MPTMLARMEQIVNQVELAAGVDDGKQQDRLVRPLVRTAFIAAQVVEVFQPVLPCLFRRHWIANRAGSLTGYTPHEVFARGEKRPDRPPTEPMRAMRWPSRAGECGGSPVPQSDLLDPDSNPVLLLFRDGEEVRRRDEPAGQLLEFGPGSV